MVVPPSYADLGKSARDLFGKGFNYGSVNVELKTKTSSGVAFTTGGSSKLDSAKLAASLETKYDIKEHGLTLSEKWTTDNLLTSEITLQDKLAAGLKLTLESAMSPQSGKKAGKVKASYAREYLNVNGDMDLDFGGPTVNAAAVLAYDKWVAGTQLAFDTAASKLTKSNFAIGHHGGDFELNLFINDGANFSGSLFQKVSSSLSTGVTLAWSQGSASTSFGLASKYAIDADASIATKINNDAQIGLSYVQSLRPGIKATVSTLVEGKNFNAGGHKVGFGLDFES
jgi:hypothetical protein